MGWPSRVLESWMVKESFHQHNDIFYTSITINTPVVRMARDVMVLMRCGQYPLQGPLEGVGSENRDFFGP